MNLHTNLDLTEINEKIRIEVEKQQKDINKAIAILSLRQLPGMRKQLQRSWILLKRGKIYNSISINADRVIFLCENISYFFCHI